MNRVFLRVASISGIIAVILGAFTAHYLKSKISDHAIATFETGVKYQFYHTFALLIVGIITNEKNYKAAKYAGGFLIAGIILFSFSLYFLGMLQASVSPDYKWIGMITPFGGLCLIAGWMMLLVSVNKMK